MLKHYLKIAISVLKRNKFFTFVSLFGITFTLTGIILLTSLLDHLLSPSLPDVNRKKELFITELKLVTNEDFLNIGQLSFYFVERYLPSLKIPKKIAFATEPRATNTYINNKKITVDIKYTNDQFWDVFQYEFLEGKPYNTAQVQNGEKIVVISEDTRRDFFGNDPSTVGKFIEIDNAQYRVIGVVKNVPASFRFNYANAYLPYKEAKINFQSKAITGNFTATILADKEDDLPKIQEEYTQMLTKIPLNGTEYKQIYSYAGTYLTTFTRPFLNAYNFSNDSGVAKAFSIMGIFVFLFLLLPIMNLININISRITERYAEIGIRKAFGASSGTLATQFIIENILLTLIGGVLAVLLSFVIIKIFNGSHLVDNMNLVINIKVLFYSLIACLVLGFISGVFPAWRMSRLNIQTALKS
jgi:putative ABC transport system permease protein